MSLRPVIDIQSAALAALLANPLRVARVPLGQFYLELNGTTFVSLQQKRAPGGDASTIAPVAGGGGGGVPQSRVAIGNSDGSGLTSSAGLTYDPATGALRTPIVDVTGGTAFRLRVTATPTVDGTINLPLVIADTLVACFAQQTLTNKRLATNIAASNWSGSVNNAVVLSGLTLDALGTNGSGAGANGLGIVLPFRASNSVGGLAASGGVQSALDDATVGAARGYTALCGTYNGTVSAVFFARSPESAMPVSNGVEVEGALSDSSPTLRARGGDTDIGLRIAAKGQGRLALEGRGNWTYTSAAGLELITSFVHRTPGATAQGDGVAISLDVAGGSGNPISMAGVVGVCDDATPGSEIGSFALVTARGEDLFRVLIGSAGVNSDTRAEVIAGSGEAIIRTQNNESDESDLSLRASANGRVILAKANGDPIISANDTGIGFNGAAPVAPMTFTVDATDPASTMALLNQVMAYFRSRGDFNAS